MDQKPLRIFTFQNRTENRPQGRETRITIPEKIQFTVHNSHPFLSYCILILAIHLTSCPRNLLIKIDILDREYTHLLLNYTYKPELMNMADQRQQQRSHERKPGSNKKTFSCPLLSTGERQAVTVPMASLEHPTQGLLAKMKQYGYCIVPDLLPEPERAEDMMLRDLVELVDTSKISGGSARERAWKEVLQHGLSALPQATAEVMGNKGRFQKCGLPQGHFAWYCRRHPNVKRVYKVFHKNDITADKSEDPLVASIDNSFFSSASGTEEATNRFWPHVDLNENITDHDYRSWEIYQGLVYIWSSEAARSSTTVIWPGSHIPSIFGNYTSDPKTKASAFCGRHFVPISSLSSNKNAMDRGYRAHARRVTVPAGGGLFWSSRTTHQGWSGGPRLAQPVCWEPRIRRTRSAYIRKLYLAATGLPSTHWASLGQPHNLVPPRTPQATTVREEDESDDTNGIIFPLRPTVRSTALASHVKDPLEVWKRIETIKPDQPFPEDVIEFLESVVSVDYKKIL